MTLASLALSLAAMALLALSMLRHSARVARGHGPSRRRIARVAGWGLLLLSLALCAAGRGWRIGMIEWIGLLALNGGAVTMLLTYRPGWLPALVGLAGLAAVAAACW